jgi:autotransporter-associated beta strand protein
MLLRRLSPALIVGCVLALIVPSAQAQIVYNLGVSGTWNATASWNPTTIPNAVGANATFNGVATGSNPAQTANRTVTLDGAKTVGSIVFNTDLSTFTNSVTTGTGGPLTFDEVGSGPATIVTQGVGTGNNTISVAMVLNDTLVATVNNTAATNGAGSLNLTATITGTGGFTKSGDGTATFGTGTKTYTGPTILNGGRLRMSVTAAASATSSFTISNGGQLDIIAAGTVNLGGNVLNLNGAGPTTGPIAAFPGAIRPDTGLAIVISTPSVVLQTDSLIHVQGAAAGVLTLQGTVSGPGRLSFGALPFNQDLGKLILSNTSTVTPNIYSGGTTINGGTLEVSAGATTGVGNMTVNSANAQFATAQAHLLLDGTGPINAIADSAVLSLAGGNAAGVADDGYVDLTGGGIETVAGLILGGVSQAPGIYTAITSPEYILGSGSIVVPVPEPGSMALAGLAVAGFGARLFRRKKAVIA